MDVDHEGAGTTMRSYRRVSLHLHTPHSIQSKYAHVSTCTSIIVLTGRRAPSRLRLFFASDLSFSARTFHPPNDYILHLQPPPTSSNLPNGLRVPRFSFIPLAHVALFSASRPLYPTFTVFLSAIPGVLSRLKPTRDSIISRLLSAYLDLHPCDSCLQPPLSTSILLKMCSTNDKSFYK